MRYYVSKEEFEKLEEEENFYQIFLKNTEKLSLHEKTAVLYRFPWHIWTIMMSSRKEQLNLFFIEQIASVSELTKFEMEDISYFTSKAAGLLKREVFSF